MPRVHVLDLLSSLVKNSQTEEDKAKEEEPAKEEGPKEGESIESADAVGEGGHVSKEDVSWHDEK